MKKTKIMTSMITMIALLVLLSACGSNKSDQQENTGKNADAAPVATPAPQEQNTAAETAFYATLPFKDILPLEKGDITIDGKQEEIKIGFSQTCFNHPWRVAMGNAAKEEAARHSNVKLIVTDGNCDVVKQSSDVSDLLTQGIDALVISPLESGGLKNAVEKAMAAGIPVITLDRDVNTKKTLFMGQSNYTIGSKIAEALVKDLDGKGNIVEIQGLLGTSVATDRHEGFMSVVKNYPDIKVLATGDGQFIRDPANKLMTDWLTAYNEIDAVYSHAEESAWGAVKAIESAGRQGDGIKQYTIDSSNEGFRSVQSGEFAADGNYTAYIGDIGVRAALYLLMGNPIPDVQSYDYGDEVVLPELPVATKDNVDQWLDKGWGE